MMVQRIVLIVIDCLRADHVSCYGYHRATTPAIDALADRGILWEQAHAASSWTKPSVASLLTGLYPTQHGAFRGIKRSKGKQSVRTDVLQSSLPTMAERFTEAGWRCAAFINNAQLGEFTGLNRGFQTYVPTAGKADRLIGLFFDWLKADLGRPAFAYLHFLEAHWPYKPRRRHVAMFGGDRDTNHFRDFSARDFGRLRRALSQSAGPHQENAYDGVQPLPGDRLEQMIQMYDGAVRRLDGKIRNILAGLHNCRPQDQMRRPAGKGEKRGLALGDETAVVVTADHGEEFLEHGQIGHGQSLYNELTHVPLVACIPDLPAGTRRSDPVSLVDLPQTLLCMAGLDGDPSVPPLTGGRSVGRRSLLEPAGADPSVYAELSIRRRYTQTVRTKEWKLHRRYKFEPTNAQADMADRQPPREWMSSCPHRTRIELYNMNSDPYEKTDLADDPGYSDVAAGLVAQLDRWWEEVSATTGEHGPGDVEIDDRVVQRLRDLGYLE